MDVVNQLGGFQITLKNPTRITNTTSVIPYLLKIPNMKQNVHLGHEIALVAYTTASVSELRDDLFTVVVPPGQYNTSEYSSLLTSLYTAELVKSPPATRKAGGLIFGVGPSGHITMEKVVHTDASGGVYSWTSTGYDSDSYHLVTSEDTFHFLGYSSHHRPSYIDEGLHELQVRDLNNTLQETGLPDAGGDNVLYVSIREFGPNLIGSDGIERNIFAAVDLADTPYGEYSSQRSSDFYLDNIITDSSYQQTFHIEILDSKFRMVKIPINKEVVIVLKLFYRGGV
jgi:hypothetical protein